MLSLFSVVVTAANSDDRQGLKALLARYFAEGIQWLRKIRVDGNDSGYVLQK